MTPNKLDLTCIDFEQFVIDLTPGLAYHTNKEVQLHTNRCIYIDRNMLLKDTGITILISVIPFAL